MYRFKVFIKSHLKKTIVLFIVLITYYFCLSKQIFKDPTATVITSNSDELIGALIADDGQWRFPQTDSIPEKFKTCILVKSFQYLIGVNI